MVYLHIVPNKRHNLKDATMKLKKECNDDFVVDLLKRIRLASSQLPNQHLVELYNEFFKAVPNFFFCETKDPKKGDFIMTGGVWLVPGREMRSVLEDARSRAQKMLYFEFDERSFMATIEEDQGYSFKTTWIDALEHILAELEFADNGNWASKLCVLLGIPLLI